MATGLWKHGPSKSTCQVVLKLKLVSRFTLAPASRFKRVWYLINGCAVPLTFFILIFFLRQIRNDLRDAEAGQQEARGGGWGDGHVQVSNLACTGHVAMAMNIYGDHPEK